MVRTIQDLIHVLGTAHGEEAAAVFRALGKDHDRDMCFYQAVKMATYLYEKYDDRYGCAESLDRMGPKEAIKYVSDAFDSMNIHKERVDA